MKHLWPPVTYKSSKLTRGCLDYRAGCEMDPSNSKLVVFTNWLKYFQLTGREPAQLLRQRKDRCFSDRSWLWLGPVCHRKNYKSLCLALGFAQRLCIAGHPQGELLNAEDGSERGCKAARESPRNESPNNPNAGMRNYCTSWNRRDFRMLHLWLGVWLPNKLQPYGPTDRWIQGMLKTVSATHHQVAEHTLEANVQKVDKVACLLHLAEWNIGEWVTEKKGKKTPHADTSENETS